jgi:hypothetical protein
MDLQLPVQSVPITTNVVSSNPVHGEVYSTTLCDKHHKSKAKKNVAGSNK